MTAVILEDEMPASQRLQKAIAQVYPSMQVLCTIPTVAAALKYFRAKGFPSILFMDIELGDGRSFNVFDEMHVTCPVIFTTAYDQYWQQAFEQNSIDYLLKPVKKDRLLAAILKYQSLKEFYAMEYRNVLSSPAHRFLIKQGSSFLQVRLDDIAYFYASEKLVFLVTTDGRKHLVPETLTGLEEKLDKQHFRRVNRKFIVHLKAIRQIKSIQKSKLQLALNPATEEPVKISHLQAALFKKWLQRQ